MVNEGLTGIGPMTQVTKILAQPGAVSMAAAAITIGCEASNLRPLPQEVVIDRGQLDD
jgi:hypothetical protein